MFIVLLSFSGSFTIKCMSLSNEQCKFRRTLIDLNSVELNYYSFMIRLDKCNGSCNTHTKISGRMRIPNKTEDVNLSAFSLITRKS